MKRFYSEEHYLSGGKNGPRQGDTAPGRRKVCAREERNVTQIETPAALDRSKFGVSCKAGDVATLTTSADSLVIEASLRIASSNATELWPCVNIYSWEERDGSSGTSNRCVSPRLGRSPANCLFSVPIKRCFAVCSCS